MATVTYDHATRLYPGTERPAVDQLNLHIEELSHQGRLPHARQTGDEHHELSAGARHVRGVAQRAPPLLGRVGRAQGDHHRGGDGGQESASVEQLHVDLRARCPVGTGRFPPVLPTVAADPTEGER